jgi:hypothetical protein
LGKVFLGERVEAGRRPWKSVARKTLVPLSSRLATQKAKSAPGKSEVIFNKEHRYFLGKLFEESNPGGSAVVKSGYE